MARYSELYLGDELTKLRDGLDVLRRIVDGDRLAELEVYLYGIVTDEFVIDMAKETIIADDEESFDEQGETSLTEGDIELTEVAVAVQISSSDMIDLLYGRGVPLDGLSFAYMSGEGEGVRSLSFGHMSTSTARLTADNMTSQAIAEGDYDLDEYLKQKGTGSKVTIKRKVDRDMEATTPAPHPPEEAVEQTPEAPAPPPVPPQGTPKQTSLKISDLLEGFLG